MDFGLYDASDRCLTIYLDEVDERATAQWKCGNDQKTEKEPEILCADPDL